MSVRRFCFLHEPRFLALLRLGGITPETCWVEVDDETVEVRFGPWRVRTPLDNVADVSVGGPYQWLKVIGPRMSLADRGATFGTNAHAGACLRFRQPVPALLGSAVRHPGLTVTVADPAGLAREIRARRQGD